MVRFQVTWRQILYDRSLLGFRHEDEKNASAMLVRIPQIRR